jgi:hypothetical protein
MPDQPIPKQTIFFQYVLGISLLQSREISSTNIFWCHCQGAKTQIYPSLGVRQIRVYLLMVNKNYTHNIDYISFTWRLL